MRKELLKAILLADHPQEIVEHTVTSYQEVAGNFRLEKWKTSELDAGHFVESVRRLIENKLFGSFTAFNTAISSFNQGVLNKYEAAQGGEEYRILIPRVLFAMYCIRNKRGVGHISTISPNKLDATFILHSAKWVLAELIRLSSKNSPAEAIQLVDNILERQVDLIWEDDETFMVLDKKLKTSDKILLVLYKQDRLSADELRAKVDYKNKSAFTKIIRGQQKEKAIAITAEGICKLSPLGVMLAEEIINKSS
ncbi:hypothetical protein [Massilia agri]|uniref:Uncharacterized protein n=1 Tax=Massilia agri TaxID=1886785 RepID=A0ABT2AH76_9BURK|nr:hypothetical protein [Massilia agri]MCS0595551.1 hypothetical protein [Massilia agri]